MPIERVSSVLSWAEKTSTAILAFNCFDYHTIYSAINAANQAQVPVICMLYPEHSYKFNLIGLKSFAQTVEEIASQADIPVVIHLDHCGDLEYIKKAIISGFNSVMYDGSRLSFEENMLNCERIVSFAHEMNVDVEAELGYIGSAEAIDEQNDAFFTNPDFVVEFARKTNVDSIAVAIGNAHGEYLTSPRLNQALLKEINSKTDTPLVLHGGTGIPKDQVQQAIRNGINKINIGTGLHNVWRQSYVKHLSNSNNQTVEAGKYIQQDLTEYLLEVFKNLVLR